MLTNAELSELLRRAADERDADHRRRALARASWAAMFVWPEEAADLVASGRSLLELPSVGGWIGRRLLGWLESSPVVPEPDETRRDFLTLSRAGAILAGDPAWHEAMRGDLQVHTTYSDGSLPVAGMGEAARARGYAYVAITDHSKSLKVARGMDEGRLAAQGEEIRALNDAAEGFRFLRSIETDILGDGSLDMEPEALAELDLVLGAVHTQLRSGEDQTERYLTALSDPVLRILGHPRGRRFGRRAGARADWERVVDGAVRHDVAIEIDASPERQDLNVELLPLVREADAWVAIDTDAHAAGELGFIVFGLAAAILAGIRAERVVNFLGADELRAWARDR